LRSGVLAERFEGVVVAEGSIVGHEGGPGLAFRLRRGVPKRPHYLGGQGGRDAVGPGYDGMPKNRKSLLGCHFDGLARAELVGTRWRCTL